MKKIKKLLLLLLVLFIGVFGNKDNTNFLKRKNARIINDGEIWTDNISNGIRRVSGIENDIFILNQDDANTYYYNYFTLARSHYNIIFNQQYNNVRVSLFCYSPIDNLENIYCSNLSYTNIQLMQYIGKYNDKYIYTTFINSPCDLIGVNVGINAFCDGKYSLMITNDENIYYNYQKNEQLGYTIERYEEEINQTSYENNYNALIDAVENINNTELIYWSYNGYTYNSEIKSQRITISPVDNNGEQAQVSMSASNTTSASNGPAMTTSIVGVNTILQAGYFDFLNWRDYFEDITFYIGEPFNEFLRFKVVENTITSGLRIETDATGNNTLITYQMNENDILRNNRVYISQDIISRFKKTNISNIRLNYKPSFKTLSSATKYFTIATNMIRTLNEDEETYYNAGYNSGLVDGEKSAFSFEWIKEGVRTAFTIFDMKLAGDVTLGNIIFIPLVIGALVFIIKIALKGGGD